MLSKFIANAVEQNAGPGRGLMQLNLDTINKELPKKAAVNIDDWSNPTQNIGGGVRWLFNKWNHRRDEEEKGKRVSSWWRINENEIKMGQKKFSTKWYGAVMAYNGGGSDAWEYASMVYKSYMTGTDPHSGSPNELF